MRLDKIKPREHDIINVIVETPKGCKHKYNYVPELELFRLDKTLPLGNHFPFDFGFIPNTIAADGDPLDALVISDEPSYPGCLIECRALGLIEAMQEEHKQKPFRNDRIVVVNTRSTLYASLMSVADLNKHMVREIEQFFINYNESVGKIFKPLKWVSTKQVCKMIDKHISML